MSSRFHPDALSPIPALLIVCAPFLAPFSNLSSRRATSQSVGTYPHFPICRLSLRPSRYLSYLPSRLPSRYLRCPQKRRRMIYHVHFQVASRIVFRVAFRVSFRVAFRVAFPSHLPSCNPSHDKSSSTVHTRVTAEAAIARPHMCRSPFSGRRM